jgi:hypothetical protein
MGKGKKNVSHQLISERNASFTCQCLQTEDRRTTGQTRSSTETDVWSRKLSHPDARWALRGSDAVFVVSDLMTLRCGTADNM